MEKSGLSSSTTGKKVSKAINNKDDEARLSLPLKKRLRCSIRNDKDGSSIARTREERISITNENKEYSPNKSRKEKDSRLTKEILQKLNNVSEITLSIPYKNKEIPAVLNCASSESNNIYWIVLTHGAGGDLNTPQLKAISSFLSTHGFSILRFTCKGLNIKYRMNVFSEILSFLCQKYDPKGIFIGGRSMGARAAVMLVSGECLEKHIVEKLLGIICLSYPLHKVNDTSELREEPLLKLRKPIFFLSGTRDEMCEKHILEKVHQNMESPFSVHWLQGYDHSARSNSNYEEDMYLKAFGRILSWCQQISDFADT